MNAYHNNHNYYSLDHTVSLLHIEFTLLGMHVHSRVHGIQRCGCRYKSASEARALQSPSSNPKPLIVGQFLAVLSASKPKKV